MMKTWQELKKDERLMAVEELVDMYLDEGATVEMLRKEIWKCINRWDAEKEVNREYPEWMTDVYLPIQDTLYKGLAVLDVMVALGGIIGVKKEDFTFEFLMRDYGTYAGHLAMEGEFRTPMQYLSDFMETSEQPPKAACLDFLHQFHGETQIEEFMESIQWDEDEEPTDGITEVVEEEEPAPVVKAVEKKRKLSGWDHNEMRENVRESLMTLMGAYVGEKNAEKALEELHMRIQEGFVGGLGDLYSQIVMAMEEVR